MKKQIKSVLLVALFIGYSAPIWGQASTEGKDFWVALTMSIRPPGDGDGEATPYLAISTKEETKIIITNPAFKGDTIKHQIAANTWYKVENIPQNWWYPAGVGKPSKVKEHADEVNKYGILVEADKKISVYAILRAGAGMDASNILPVTAIQKEYILQDYVPHAKSGDSPFITMATILATDNNTTVTIKPLCTTLAASTPKLVNNKITLNKGETYYLMAENDGSNNNSLSGTEITADKNIAVFQGVPCTFLPHDVGNRDCLFEQAMPLIYWGTKFIATRSYAKGANFIRVTASNDGTTVKVKNEFDEHNFVINRGQTYEIELAASNNMNNDKYTRKADYSFIGEYVYIETSCPCAVYSYDVGKGYNDKNKTELSPEGEQEGDPSSVWISPIEQSIKQITFGLCGTKSDGGNQTIHHYLDLIVPTKTAKQTIITPAPEDPNYNVNTSFIPLDEEIGYSFARIYLAKADDKENRAFTISNPGRFVGHVYGNGKSESYAYSIGSAAESMAIYVGDFSFGTEENNDDIIFNYDAKYCVDDTLNFDISNIKREIERVDYDFDDGVTVNFGPTDSIKHVYTTPGPYRASVRLVFSKEEKKCETMSEEIEKTISFVLNVVRAETLELDLDKRCISLEKQDANPSLIAKAGTIERDTLDTDHCYDTLKIRPIYYGLVNKFEMRDEDAQTVRDSIQIGGKWYYDAPEIQSAPDTLAGANRWGCDSIVIHKLRVVTSLKLEVDTDSVHCCKGDTIELPCTYTKGQFGKVWMVDLANPNDTLLIPTDFLPNKEQDSIIFLPTKDFKPGKYQMRLYAIDAVFDDTLLQFDFVIEVYYPSDIFKFKFNNVLAVYKPGYGGNTDSVDFTAYQWYIDGQLVEGEVESIYYNGDGKPFEENTEVYVELTTVVNGDTLTLPSCSQTLTNIPNYKKDPEDKANQAPAQKMLIDQRMYILKGKEQYNIYGQKVK